MQERRPIESWRELFAIYSEYNKTLRTWFVTFGLGGPSLFLINDKLFLAVKASGNGRIIVWSFLGGCAIQILIALINKHAEWHAYDADRFPEKANTKWYRLWLHLEKCYWIDLAGDVATIVLFSLAVWNMMATFAA